jgi:acetyl-CoA carboxylase biotin carboxyl carrier protein
MTKLEELSDDEIAKIGSLIENLDKSAFDFMSLELADFKLTVGTGNLPTEVVGSRISTQEPQASPARGTLPDAPAVLASQDSVQTRAAPQGTHAPQKATVAGVEVTATTMGRFYSRPAPNAAPFVTVGDKVTADSTVGLIELMKLFNGVVAGVKGVVVQINVEDGELVEYGQVLMRIEPADSAVG